MGFSIRNLLAVPKAAAPGRNGSEVMRATWRGATLAESDKTIVIEGTHYFPPGSVRAGLLKPSQTHTTCPTKSPPR